MRILRLALIVALLVGSGHAARAEYNDVAANNAMLMRGMGIPLLPDAARDPIVVGTITGHWNQMPRFGGAGSTYPYAMNNPLTRTDPTGLDATLFIPGTPGVQVPPNNLPLYPLPAAAPLQQWWYNITPQQRDYACSFGVGTALCTPLYLGAPEGVGFPLSLACKGAVAAVCAATCSTSPPLQSFSQ